MRVPTLKMSYCAECGEVRVPHALTRMSSYLPAEPNPESLFGKVTGLFDRAAGILFTPERMVRFATLASRLGMGTIVDTPTAKDSTRTLALYEGAAARGVVLRAWKLGSVTICHIAEKEVLGNVERVLFTVIPRPNGFMSPSLSWMDDKGILKQKLVAADLPCARGGVAETLDEALALFRAIGRPVIAKPFSGSRGRHTTLDIRTEEELARGFRIAKEIARAVVIEAYLHGTVHRVTLVGGRPVAIARREYPHVIGDGMYTVRELVAIENEKPYRNGLFFRPLDLAHRADAALKKQDLTPDSIPEEGRMVILNDKNSRLHGTLTEDVTDTVHPDNLALFKRIGDMLGDPIVGLDFMIRDMRRPWTEQPDAGVIECNSMPFIDVHHQVVSGRPINVAAYLWDEVFKERVSA